MVDAHRAFVTPDVHGAGLGGHELLARRRVPPRAGAPDQERGRRRPFIVGIGGTARPDSTTRLALMAAMQTMSAAGAQTTLLGPAELDLPLYNPDRRERPPAARRLLTEVAHADGVVIATPGYHGGMSGLVKNALDYLEDLRDAPRPYLEGRPVGLIVCADGPQSTGTTLTSLRSSVHALRGWPTPLGVSIDTAVPQFDADGTAIGPGTAGRLESLADQVMGFAYAWSSVI